MDEEKSRHASLAQHNGFGLAFLHSLRRQPNAQQSRTHVVDWSRWIAISRLTHICSPSFRFKGKVKKQQITKLRCEKYFYGVTVNIVTPEHS